ncbi:hypothetical protein BBZ05_04165 [Campylobacter lari]|nr:hypothetical protein [Campylobacter lari]
MNTEKILNFLKIQTHYFCAYETTINNGKRIKGSCIVINIRYFWKKNDPIIPYVRAIEFVREKFETENINFTQFHKL